MVIKEKESGTVESSDRETSIRKKEKEKSDKRKDKW